MKKDEMIDELIQALEKDENVQALYDVWSMINAVPSKAVSILLQFQDVSASAKKAVDEMRRTLEDVKQLEAQMGALEDGVAFLGKFRESVLRLDEDLIMNRLARLTSMAGQIRKLQEDGSLELIEGLLLNKGK